VISMARGDVGTFHLHWRSSGTRLRKCPQSR
jgi:hypothetical protein